MGKLGKKARKFAKKNLQSVMKRKRKLNVKFNKKKKPSRDQNDVEEKEGDVSALSSRRTLLPENAEDLSLDILSSEEGDDMVENDSDNEGYLPEDPDCHNIGGNDNGSHSEDGILDGELSAQNQKLLLELSEKKKKLEVLKNKDSKFADFLQDRIKELESSQNEDMSDDEEMNDDDDMPSSSDIGKSLNNSAFNSWCQILKDQNKPSIFPTLLNAYRAACHYGVESTNADSSISPPKIMNRNTYSNVIMFMLCECDSLFRGLLGISSKIKVDAVLNLKTSSKWESVKPMIKSYITSCLLLLNQFTDSDMLVFVLTRVRASLIFFVAFPSLLGKLIEACVHMWATGGGVLSSSAFLILNDVSLFGDKYYEKCSRKTYRAILSHCKVVDGNSLKQIEYLIMSFVELCSIDMKKSFELATVSIQKLARVLQLGLQSKKEEALSKICSWEFTLCIDIWVEFVSANIKDNDLHSLLFTLIQVINGVVNLFGAHRYLPLKVRCIRWLNRLSSSSDIFIPVSLFILDVLESTSVEVGKPGDSSMNLSTILKVPKYWIKTRNFQEECVFTAVELLSVHFLKWSHHISFPELATIPIIRLKQFHEKSTVESLRRIVKRLIDQVEKNIEFVVRKRDEVSFSPKDQGSADSFLQAEKCGGDSPYIQYYKSVIQNATTRKVDKVDRSSSAKPNNPRQKKRKLPPKAMSENSKQESKKTNSGHSNGNLLSAKVKKQE